MIAVVGSPFVTASAIPTGKTTAPAVARSKNERLPNDRFWQCQPDKQDRKRSSSPNPPGIGVARAAGEETCEILRNTHDNAEQHAGERRNNPDAHEVSICVLHDSPFVELQTIRRRRG